MRTLFVLLVLIGCARSALPPGYEEELYCPSHTCLKHKAQPPGWTGPRSMFHECCDESNGQVVRPHAWGEKVPIEIREGLIKHGWHTGQCAQQKGVCGTRSQRVALHSLLGLMARLEGALGSA